MMLKGKVAVITGTSMGIGQATALLFAREGARVICMDTKPGDETLKLIRAENLDAVHYDADVSKSAQVQAVARECEKTVGKVDILFNNAGSVRHKTFEETTEEDWAEMIGVNLTGEFLCAKYFLPLLKESGAGSIINHASIDGVLGNPYIVAYSAAKGGLIPLTHVMAHNLGQYNIRVNCISSGGIVAARNAVAKGSGPPGQSRIVVTPLQRKGSPDEVAKVALFLASDLSSFVNGANIVVDGGRTVVTQGTYHGYD